MSASSSCSSVSRLSSDSGLSTWSRCVEGQWQQQQHRKIFEMRIAAAKAQ